MSAPNSCYKVSIILIPKPDRKYIRKPHKNIPYEHIPQNYQQNISKLHLAMYKINNTLISNRIFFQEYNISKMIQSNLQIKIQMKQKHMTICIDAEQAFDRT